MANYDQAGNPVGGNAGQQRSGQGASGQQSQFSSGNNPGQNQGQNQGRSMQRAGGPSGRSGSFAPEFYGGMGGGPFQLISRLSDEMDRIFESFGMGTGSPRAAGQAGGQRMQQGNQGMRSLWAPHIEVAEREGKLIVQADLPGVRKEDVNVQLEDDALIIQGQRQQQNERSEQGFYHTERSYGAFYRMIPLPEGTDAEQATATFRDGVLHIEVPLPQQRQRGRRLEIRDGGGQGTSASGGQPSQGGSAQSQQGQGSYGQQGSSGSPGAQQHAGGTSERR